MSFVGAIPSRVRQVLAGYAKGVRHPALVIGAGNFTVPAVLRSAGCTGPVTACDVSLYSSAIGACLAGWKLQVRERDDCPDHLRGLLRTESPELLAASVALLMDLQEVWQARNAFQQRQVANYRKAWDRLLEKALGNLGKFRAHVGQLEYEARDGFELLAERDPGHAVFAFPPTYKGGYERMERLLQAVAEWQAPTYREMNDKGLELYEAISRFREYYVVLEKDLPEAFAILGQPVAVLPRGRGRHSYILARQGRPFVLRPRAKSAAAGVIWPPDRPVTGSETPSVALLSRPQSLRLNELYLSRRIDYFEGDVAASVGFLLDGRIIGKADFVRTRQARWKLPDDSAPAYVMCDLAVPSCERRLAKLVLLLMLSHEVKAVLDARCAEDFGWALTTAFSASPVSMKYRGVFTLYSRKKTGDGFALNYYAAMGRHGLVEALATWMKKYNK